MSVDIGPRIGIDGEAEFRRELKNLSQQMRTLGSEMKAVTSAFEDNDKSQEAVAARSEVLTRQIQVQQQKLAQLKKGLAAAADQYGEADTKTLKWAQAVNDATADLNRLRTQLSKAEDALDDLKDTTKDAGDAIDSSSEKFDAAAVTIGNLASNAISTAVSAVGDLISSLWNLDEATEEYRNNMGLVSTAFESNGYTVETAKQAYEGLFAILGDSGTAAEASSLLATLALGQQDVATWTNIAAGVYGTFGEALPINSLIEAANETAEVGKVTGVLADALNWVGISEDAFNAKLAAASWNVERNTIIMGTLSEAYSDAADAFYRNNEAVVSANKAQAQMDDSLSNLGESVEILKTSLLTALGPAIEQIANQAADFLDGLDANAVADTILTLVEAFRILAPVIVGATTAMIAYKAASTISGLIGALTSTLHGATAATTGFNAALNANPIVAVITLVASLVSAFITLMMTSEDFRDAVLGVFEAIKDGISAVVDWFSEKFGAIKDAFGWLVDGIKSLLGIHSPSKVFREIGENMAGGIGVGWEKTWANIAPEIGEALTYGAGSDMAAQMQRAIPASVARETATAGRSAGGQGSGSLTLPPIIIDATWTMDGQVMARRQFTYNERETLLRGGSLVGAGG